MSSGARVARLSSFAFPVGWEGMLLMATSDWFPKSQDFIARRGLFTLGEIKPRNDESRKTIGRLRNPVGTAFWQK